MRPRSVLRRVDAGDGTQIAWHTHSEGRPGCASILLTNGLSTTPNFWSHLIGALAPNYGVVHWDYRGHGQSDLARSGDYTIATHADDLRRVAEAVHEAGEDGAPRRAPVHVAFSMGVTVLLELYRRRPDLVRAMVLIAGGADQPRASSPAFRVPGVRAALRTGLRAAAPVVPLLAPIARRVSASPALFPLARALGAIGPEAPREEVEHFFRAVGSMDMRAYWGTLRSLLDARASDVLPKVRVPVLIVAPEHDVMAPQGDLDQLRESIRGAAWMRVPRAGHAVLLEAGDAVAERVRAFVREVEEG